MMWYWHKNRIENSEINPCLHGVLIYDKQVIYYRVKTASSINCVGKATGKRIKLDHFLTPYTKTNSKWIRTYTHKI